MAETGLPVAPDAATRDTVLASFDGAGNLEVVRLADLHTDQAYQRELSRDLIEKIKASWDVAACGYIVVSRRDNGDEYIVNGQHRAAAATELGQSELVAQVFTGLTREQEADLRLLGNTARADSAAERFYAEVAAGKPSARAIVDICAEFATKINRNPEGASGINSVAAVRRIYDQDNGRLLTTTFEVLQDAFGKVGGRSAGVAMLSSVSWIMDRHRDEIDQKRIVARLAAVGVDGLDRKARNYRAAMGGPLWMNYYRAIVEEYNTRLADSQKIELRTRGWSRGSGPTSDWSNQ